VYFGRGYRFDFGDVFAESEYLDGGDDRIDPRAGAVYAELPTCIISAAWMLNRHGARIRIEASRAFARHVISAAISLPGEAQRVHQPGIHSLGLRARNARPQCKHLASPPHERVHRPGVGFTRSRFRLVKGTVADGRRISPENKPRRSHGARAGLDIIKNRTERSINRTLKDFSCLICIFHSILVSGDSLAVQDALDRSDLE
jgi:hypothetical protein